MKLKTWTIGLGVAACVLSHAEGIASDLTVDDLTAAQSALLKGMVLITNSVTTTGVATNDAILLFTFDGDSGATVFDATTNDHDGTAYNGCSYISGRTGGQALLLNGTSSYVRVPYSTQFHMANYTIMAWVQTTNAGSGRRRVISHQGGDGYWLMALNGNELELGSFRAGLLNKKGSALNDNDWHMVAVTRNSDNGVASWNIDGTEVGTMLFASSMPDATTGQDLYLGRVFSAGEYFHGAIDDVRIFNRALSTNDIASLYNDETASNTVTNDSALKVYVPTTFANETTILKLAPQGDIGMGTFTSGP